MSERALQLLPYEVDAYRTAVERCVAAGARRIGLRPFDDDARLVVAGLVDRFPWVELVAVPSTSTGPAGDGSGSGAVEAAPLDACFLFVEDGEALSAALMDYLDASPPLVVAPITDWYFEKRPVFLISIPKAGTHLLYGLIESLGYQRGVVLRDVAEPGLWYCVEYSNSHTSARDFFVDTTRRAPFGNRQHPFMRSPAVMIYRNPLDVVVSEANWYHKEGATPFAGYLAHLPFEQRLLRLVDDPWLLGSIRDRVGNFAAWLEFPNVIPVSFEEIVGASGGGDPAAQIDLIWSLMLKLQVPGSPDDLAARVFDPTSPTFHAGQIGAYRKRFTGAAYAAFRALPQDFMQVFGYDGSDLETVAPTPARADEFRRRPLKVSHADYDSQPALQETDLLGCNVVRLRNRFYGVPQSAGAVDLASWPDEALALLPSSSSLDDLRLMLLVGPANLEASKRHWSGQVGRQARSYQHQLAQAARSTNGSGPNE